MQPRGRYLAFGLIGVFALIAVAFLLVGGLAVTSASGGGPEMALRIKAPAPGSCAGDKCTLDPGQAFTLSVEVVTAPTEGYIGVQSFIVFGSDLIYKPAEPAVEIIWPDLEPALAVSICSMAPCTASGPAGQASHGGLTSFGFPTSTFTGNYLDLSFNCSASLSQTVVELLPLGDPQTGTEGTGFLLPPDGSSQVAAKVNSLTINCGTPPLETFTETIGASGGTLSTGSTDSVEVTLDVPLGALPDNTEITIDVFDASDVPRPPGGDGPLLSRTYEFGPPGTTFAIPVTFTYTYANEEVAGIDERFVDVAYFDSLTGQWIRAEVISRDPLTNSLTVAVPHFSPHVLSHDFDGDGCVNNMETKTDPGAEFSGGLRDWLDEWDYYDVGNPDGYASTTGAKDGFVDLFNDIVLTIQAISNYNVSADRGPSAGPNPWSMTEPDGVVDLFNDVVGVINQFGHDCRSPVEK